MDCGVSGVKGMENGNVDGNMDEGDDDIDGC
jgi:hypothetical protein